MCRGGVRFKTNPGIDKKAKPDLSTLAQNCSSFRGAPQRRKTHSRDQMLSRNSSPRTFPPSIASPTKTLRFQSQINSLTKRLSYKRCFLTNGSPKKERTHKDCCPTQRPDRHFRIHQPVLCFGSTAQLSQLSPSECFTCLPL